MKRKERTTGILQYSICSLLVLLLGSGCKSWSTPKQGSSDRHYNLQSSPAEAPVDSTRQVNEVSHERDEFKETMASLQGKFDQMSKERVKLEGEVFEWKNFYSQQKSSYDQLKKELSDVQTVAASTANELTELRLSKKELEERTKLVERENLSLRKENSKLGDKLDQTQTELKAVQAVVDSRTVKSKQTERFTEKKNEVVAVKKSKLPADVDEDLEKASSDGMNFGWILASVGMLFVVIWSTSAIRRKRRQTTTSTMVP